MLPKIYFSNTTPRTINPLFDEFFTDIFSSFKNFDNDLVRIPKNNVIESEKEYVLETELAGIKKADVSINVDDDVLTIKAERKETADNKYNRKETYFGKFERSFTLPENTDINNIDASMEDGILKVIIPKLQESQKFSKAIEIK